MSCFPPRPLLRPEQVTALEHDKRVITSAFEAAAACLQRDLGDVKRRLEALHAERDG